MAPDRSRQAVIPGDDGHCPFYGGWPVTGRDASNLAEVEIALNAVDSDS